MTVSAKWIELNNELKIKKNGQYQFKKDKEAVKSYFVDYVNQNTVFFHDLEEKLDYLFKNEYYDKGIFDKYTFGDIKDLYKQVYAKKFRFPSFMSAFKFYNNYALKTDDQSKFLERYEDKIVVNALFHADGDIEKAKENAEVMIEGGYQPSTPAFLNAGRLRGGEKVSCFLLTTPDSTEGIEYVDTSSAQLSRRGGGVGINLSKVRAEGESIKGVEGVAGGIVGVCKKLETTFNYYDQQGQRNGSGVVYLNIFHSDIEKFLDTKKINADENIRLKSLSIGVIAESKFFELAEDGKPYFVFYPYTVFKEYGIHMDDMDMDKWYDELIENKNIKKRQLDPRKMLVKIAQIQQESGYPYWMFKSNANKNHALKDIGTIEMSNLCNEVYQLSKPSIIRGYEGVDEFGYDISCVLGSLNIVPIMDKKMFRKAVRVGVNCLNTVAKSTSIDAVPTVKKANLDFQSIGLGVMNLHGFLAKNKIMFESEEAKDFANTFFMMMNFYSLERSMEISIEEGFKFKHFEKSEYAKGTYFNKYITNDYSPKTEKIKEIFKDFDIPNIEDWKRLKEQVMKNGLAHAYRQCIAPTGSISYVQNATASIAPIMEQIETRTYGDSTTHYPMPYMNSDNFFFYKTAYDIDMFKFIDLVSVIQEHVDQGISTILYVDSNKTTRELARYYIYAHKKGLKGLYYTRTKLLSVDECLSCSI